MPNGLPTDMPKFDNGDGTQMIWDPESQSYITTPIVDKRPDRGHATGGDNDLFDPFQHTEQEGVPELEGYMAKTAVEWAGPGQVKCPNCEQATTEATCPTCGKDLTPEWNQEKGNEFMGIDTPHSDASEYTSWPERVPKKNRMKTDDSFPSMSLSKTFEIAQKIAHQKLSEEDWDAMFGGEEPQGTVEIGKWLVDKQGQLHYEHGMHGFHDQIAARDGLAYPADIGALGSIYNDGTGDVQRVFPDFQFDLPTVQAQVETAFGPVQLNPPPGYGQSGTKGPVFKPEILTGGQWIIDPSKGDQQVITGVAWVKEKAQGPYNPNQILVAGHLQPEDFELWHSGCKAIITATGGMSSHAAYLASTMGIPTIVGLGEAYSKIESGNYLKIDTPTKSITVMPGATSETDPGTKQQVWDSILQHQLQHGGSVREFAHVDEEIAWNLVHGANLDNCPECDDVMVDQDGEKVCHGCGHKQKIVQHEAGFLLPLGLEAAGAIGDAAAGAGPLMTKALQGGAFRAGEKALPGGGPGGGDAGGGEAAPQDPTTGESPMPGTFGSVMAELKMQHEAGVLTGLLKELYELMGQGAAGAGKALADPANPLAYVDDAAAAVAGGANSVGTEAAELPQYAPGTFGHVAKEDTFGEEEVGWATKNRGENSDPETASSGGIAGEKEHGDGPEQLKDVDGDGGPQTPNSEDDLGNQGDPEMQDKATKAFHLMLPLVMEYANSDKPGSEHPMLVELDRLLEEAFPGYKDGHDQQDGAETENPNDAPSDDESGEEPDDGDDKDAHDVKNASVWYAAFEPDVRGTGKDAYMPGSYGAPKEDDDDDDGYSDLERDLNESEEYLAEERKKDAEKKKWNGVKKDAPETEYGVHASVDNEYGDFVHEAFAPMPNYGTPPDQGAPGAVSVNPSCPMCGQSHVAGTPCPTSNQQAQPPAPINGAPIAPPAPMNKVVTKFQTVAFGGMFGDIEQNPPGSIPNQGQPQQAQQAPLPQAQGPQGTPCPNCGQSTVPSNGGACQNCGSTNTTAPVSSEQDWQPPQLAPGQLSARAAAAPVDDEFAMFAAADGIDYDWVDAEGGPIEAGNQYEMKTASHAIPDKITIEQVLPHKITFIVHSGGIDYRHDLTKEQVDTDGTIFTPVFSADEGVDSSDGFEDEAPVRPGQDSGAQVDDLSTPSTVVSKLVGGIEVSDGDFYQGFTGDAPESREWLREGGVGDGVAVDPELLQKLAGKDFSAREQRAFIDETGEARNLDRLDLDGTHYITDGELDEAFNW